MHTPPGAELFYSGIFGQGGGLSVYLEALCTGNETSFLQCPLIYNCICSDHTRDKGVRCAPGLCKCSCSSMLMTLYHSFIMLKCLSWLNDQLFLVNVCYGGRWGMVSGPAWTLSEASVVCRQLHYAPVALKALTYSRDIAPAGSIAFSQFYCAGYEKKHSWLLP